MFANGLGEQDSIPGQIIPKTQKMVLDASLLTLSIIRYGSRVSRATQGKEYHPFSLHLIVAIEKGSPQVALDYSQQE